MHSSILIKALIVFLVIFQDYILIELSHSGLKGSAESSEVEAQDGDVTLVVNPNYTLDD